MCRRGGSRVGVGACARALERVRGELLGEDVEDEVDGVDEVELDDGAPGGALGCPCLRRERQLEVCAGSLVMLAEWDPEGAVAYFSMWSTCLG